MPLLEANWNPSSRQLRQFCGIAAVMLPGLAWWWSGSVPVIVAAAAAGLLLALVAWCVPRAVAPLFIAALFITLPIGMVVGEAAMIAIYLGVFLPIGLLFRLCGRDRLQRRFDRQRTSYWQPKPAPKSIASYYRQS